MILSWWEVEKGYGEEEADPQNLLWYKCGKLYEEGAADSIH